MCSRVIPGRASRVRRAFLSGIIPIILAAGLFCPEYFARPMPQARISVQSSAVSVPTFVFQRKDLIAQLTNEQLNCLLTASNDFAALPPSQPFEPTDCGIAEIENLSVRDFRLFQDGAEQKILAVIPEEWQSPVRDNFTWHNATSDTPSGIWSSTDLRADTLRVKFWPQMYSRFYNLVYTPPGSTSGCHRITVAVNKKDAQVFARDEYCAEQSPSDVLSGTKEGAKLQRFLESPRTSKIPLSLQVGAFQMNSEGSRVDVSLQFPWDRLNHSWVNYRLLARIALRGEVLNSGGAVVARFSDLLYPSYWPTFLGNMSNSRGSSPPAENWSPAWLPTRYETQLNLLPGTYEVKLALSDDLHFGIAEASLNVPAFDSQKLGMSSVILCKRFRDAHVAAVEAARANFAPQYVPLVSKDTQFTPAGDLLFQEDEPLIAYFEVSEPALPTHSDSRVLAHIKIIDSNSGETVNDFNPVDTTSYKKPGSSTIAIARQIPLAKLPTGTYQIEVEATDDHGSVKTCHSAEFTFERSVKE